MELPAVRTDVLVVGSGAAGLAASISAARNGAEVILVEYNGYLGGISASLPWLGFHDRDYRQVVKGICHEIVTRLQSDGAASAYTFDPKCASLLSIDTHAWKCLAFALAREAGVKLLMQTHAVDTIRDEGPGGSKIRGVIVEHKSGRQEIHAKVVIDCTGDGDVAARGGVPCQKGRDQDGLVQAPSLMVRIGGIDRNQFVKACKNREYNYREWICNYPDLWEKMMVHLDTAETFVIGGFAKLMASARDKGLLSLLPQTRIVGVKTHIPDEIMTVSTRILGLDPTDVKSLSDGYSKIYRQVPQLVEFFRDYLPGGKGALLREIAPILGVRESRRIGGDYELSADDMIGGKVFDDAVAMGGYHIDIHRPKGTWVESKNVKAYTIPLRCLIAKGVDGLMMAGKCISATHEAIAGTRVIPICMAQGQAAGTAAALSVSANRSIRDISISELQTKLVDQGAEIGRTVGSPNQEVIDRLGQLPFDEPPTTGDEDPISHIDRGWVE